MDQEPDGVEDAGSSAPRARRFVVAGVAGGVVLLLVIAAVTAFGWSLGLAVRSLLPMSGLVRLVAECALWAIVVVAVASPLASTRLRTKLAEMIPG